MWSILTRTSTRTRSRTSSRRSCRTNSRTSSRTSSKLVRELVVELVVQLEVELGVEVAAEKKEIAFEVLSDMLLHAKFDPEEIEKERGVILEELHMYEDMPTYKIGWDFEELLFVQKKLMIIKLYGIILKLLVLCIYIE